MRLLKLILKQQVTSPLPGANHYVDSNNTLVLIRLWQYRARKTWVPPRDMTSSAIFVILMQWNPSK